MRDASEGSTLSRPAGLESVPGGFPARAASRFAGTLLSLLSLSTTPACAVGRIAIDPAERDGLAGRTDIRAAHYPPPAFGIPTGGKIVGTGLAFVGLGAGIGALGLAVVASTGDPEGLKAVLGGGLLVVGGLVYAGSAIAFPEGDRDAIVKIREKRADEDPAPRVQDRFLRSVGRELGMPRISAFDAPFEDDDLDALEDRLESGTVFDFKTLDWSLGYPSVGASRYPLSYSVRARLVRIEDRKVLWQGVAEWTLNDPEALPDVQALAANRGAALKAKLAEAADFCADRLAEQFFGED